MRGTKQSQCYLSLYQIHKMPIVVPLECIINIDKLALHNCTILSRLYCTVNLDVCEVKRSKRQITMTLNVNAFGEKFITQVITKNACPRDLKNILYINKTFGIIYNQQRYLLDGTH